MELKEGSTFPDFQLPDQTGKTKKLSDLSGSKGLVLYVYPKDDTPGCTLEAQDFTSRIKDFKTAGFHIVGLSKDSVESHVDFIEKCSLAIPLLSDPEGDLVKAIGAWGKKDLYGKVSTGIIRSTFVVDKKSKVLKVYKNVRATGHAQRVLKDVQDL